jgi:sterol desaturase/sphingolipid hydroxylase (fatty acid hydroxylase superfamily)
MTLAAIILGLALPVILLLERAPATRLRALDRVRPYLADDAVYLLTSIAIGLAVNRSLDLRAPAWFIGAAWFRWADTTVGRLALIPVALILMDGINYAAHWLMHEAEFLWPFHKTHHSTRVLDSLASFRGHAVDQALRATATTVTLALAGIPLATMAAASSLWVAWSMFTHANVSLDLRWMEGVLVTPRLHRIHHVPATSGHNLGTVFSFWDRACGRLLRYDVPPDTLLGVPGEIESYPQTLGAQTVQPFREQFPPRR